MKKWVRVLGVLLVFVLLTGCVGGIPGFPSYKEYGISGSVEDIDGNPLKGVSLAISGTLSNSTTSTDKQGRWSAVVKGAVTVTPRPDRYIFEPRSRLISEASNDLDFTGRPRHVDLPVEWKHLLLVYTEVDAIVDMEDGTTSRFQTTMPDENMRVAVGGFKNLPNLIYDASNGNVTATTEVVYLDHPLASLAYGVTEEGTYNYRADPTSETVKADLATYAPEGAYDSVHVLWNNGEDGVSKKFLDTYYGLGGYLLYGGTTTFDTVVCYEPWVWLDVGEAHGEVFLHEWLHGIESFMTTWGYTSDDFPVEGLHGQEHYGYKHSPPSGWMGWYGDFMQGKVWDNEQGRYLGVTEEMWAIGNPTSLIYVEQESNLERVLRDIINKPSGDILPSDVNHIVDLVARNEGIISLSGIEHLTNLERLFLGFNHIRDISDSS
jgi:hypothetical protein